MVHGLRVVAIWLLAFCACTVCARTAVAVPEKETYLIAVIPAAPPVATHTLWVPFIERLSRDTGLDFRLKVYERMSDFERDISRGAPDFIFASSLQTVVAHQAQGYLPLVRGSSAVAVEILVRKDSPIKSVDDLMGKKIAFVGDKNL